MGYVYAAAGRRTDALAMIKELQEQYDRGEVAGQDIAIVYVGLGDKDRAFEWLDKAFQDRRGWLAYLKIEPMLDSIRDDPRFHRMLERMRLA